MPTQTVLRTKGDLYTGTLIPITVSAGKFASIGNPYASPLDMRKISSAGLKEFFYTWDSQLGGIYGFGAYQTFSKNGNGDYVVTPGGGSYSVSGSVSKYIQSGHAFLVQGTTGGGSLTFTESAKTIDSSHVSRPAVLSQPQLRTNLYGVNADGTIYMVDGVLNNYGDSYSNNVDDMDAIKSTNSAENLSIKRSGVLLVVERRQNITAQDTIFLNLTSVNVQKYRYEFTADQLRQRGLTAFVIDRVIFIPVHPLTLTE